MKTKTPKRVRRPQTIVNDPAARSDYLKGVWQYALGRPAWEHPRYECAVGQAKAEGWDAGWLRQWNDVAAALDGGCWFSEEAFERVLTFFSCLRHTEGRWAGQPFELYDVQKYDWIAPLFGWLKPNGLRRFRRGSIWVPKKQGKTAVCAALVLYMLAFDGEQGAQVYSAAVDRGQARLILEDAAAFIRRSPGFAEIFEIVESISVIRVRGSRAKYKSLSKESRSHEGLNISCGIFDEIHAWPPSSLYSVLAYGDIAREQSLFLNISTAGIYDPDSIGWREWERSKRIMEGAVEDDHEYFAYMAAVGEAENPYSPHVWKRVNPAMGVIVQPSEMKVAAARARAEPRQAADFKRYRLNRWIKSIDTYLDVKSWVDRCSGPIDDEMLAGLPVYGGVDLSTRIDLTCLVWVWGPDAAGKYYIRMTTWLPEDNIVEASARDDAPYAQWVEEGWIHATPGNIVDLDYIEQTLIEDHERLEPQKIGYDPRSATQVMVHMNEAGLPVIEVTQSYQNLSEPMKTIQSLVKAGKLRHGDNPVMRWMAGNLTVREGPSGHVVPDKRRSTGRIDGFSALATALSTARLGVEPEFIEYTGL